MYYILIKVFGKRVIFKSIDGEVALLVTSPLYAALSVVGTIANWYSQSLFDPQIVVLNLGVSLLVPPKTVQMFHRLVGTKKPTAENKKKRGKCFRCFCAMCCNQWDCVSFVFLSEITKKKL